MAPLAGPSLPPSARGPGHVHPHVAHADQLPQCQADSCCVSPQTPHVCITLPPGQLSDLPHLSLVLLASRALVGAERRGEPSSPVQQEGLHSSTGDSQEPGLAGPQVSVQEGAEWGHRTPSTRRADHPSSSILSHQLFWLDPHCSPVHR